MRLVFKVAGKAHRLALPVLEASLTAAVSRMVGWHAFDEEALSPAPHGTFSNRREPWCRDQTLLASRVKCAISSLRPVASEASS